MNFRKKNNALAPMGTQRLQIECLDGTQAFHAVTLGQLQNSLADLVIDDITLDVASIGNGTAAAPSLTWASDTDTGLYRSAANQVGVTAGGTGQVIFTDGTIEPVTTNDVDLGTTEASFKNLAFSGLLYTNGTPQTLNGAGAVNLTTLVTLVVTTGADALTLAAGTAGQHKIITMKTDGGDGTLTPTGLRGGTTITFNDVGDTVHLLYVDSAWIILSNFGCTVA